MKTPLRKLEYNRARYYAKRDELLVKAKEYYQRPEVRERRGAYQRAYQKAHDSQRITYRKAWYIANKEKHLAQCRVLYRANREARQRKSKQWDHDHRERRLEIQRRYREKNRGRIARHRICRYVTAADWSAIVESYNGQCAYSGPHGGKIEMEHVVPLSRGGEHALANIVPACSRCNRRKGTNTWIPRLPDHAASFAR